MLAATRVLPLPMRLKMAGPHVRPPPSILCSNCPPASRLVPAYVFQTTPHLDSSCLSCASALRTLESQTGDSSYLGILLATLTLGQDPQMKQSRHNLSWVGYRVDSVPSSICTVYSIKSNSPFNLAVRSEPIGSVIGNPDGHLLDEQMYVPEGSCQRDTSGELKFPGRMLRLFFFSSSSMLEPRVKESGHFSSCFPVAPIPSVLPTSRACPLLWPSRNDASRL